jgi:MYXO-CTERM domain-containing protein
VSVSYSALSFDPADTANFYLGANSNASVSRALAIDDLVLSATATAIPEPSSFAALAGLGALGLVACLRRRRSF